MPAQRRKQSQPTVIKNPSKHLPREKIMNVNFDTSQNVAAALRALRDTGFFGNGLDGASVAEELLRWALLQPGVVEHWRKS